MSASFFPPPPGKTLWPHVSKWEWPDWQHWLVSAGWLQDQIAQYQIDRDFYGLAITRPNSPAPVWLYRPTPKQVLLHKSLSPNLLWGGAAGGAKSHGLRWDAYKRCLAVPGYRALLLRRTFVELRETHLDRARTELPLFGAKLVEDEARFSNGSIIRMGYLQNLGDEQRYLSTEYDALYPDEIATLVKEQILEVMSRVRSAKEEVKAIVRAGSNPGGAHTLWCVDRFITKTVREDEDPYYVPDEWEYIPARLYDNPWLMDPDGSFKTYEKRLGPLPPDRRRQLLEGDWSAITGQYFPEFSMNTHVGRLEIPPGTRYFCCMDWGYSNPGTCYWVARLPDGHLHVCREFKFQQTIVSEVARQILRLTKDLIPPSAARLGSKVSYTVVDPAMDNKTGAVGESMLETLARYGVPGQKGDNNRVLGWQRLRHWLANAPDGRPWLTVDPSCTYLIRTLPALVSDEHDPEDVDTDGDDHAADALRYGVMSRPSPTRDETRLKPVPNSIGWWMARERTRQLYARARPR